jgi:hypothetical protein
MPFSCNTWELWDPQRGAPGCRRGSLRWLDLYGKIDFETREPIKWLSFRDGMEQAKPLADSHEPWCALSLVDGSRFMARSDVGLNPSWDDMRRWWNTKEKGCHAVAADVAMRFGLQTLHPKEHVEPSTG